MKRFVLVGLLLSLSQLWGAELDDLGARLNADPDKVDYSALASLARIAGNADIDPAMRDQARTAIDKFRRCGGGGKASTESAPAPKEAEAKFRCSVEPKIFGKREAECQPRPFDARDDSRKGCEAKAREACLKFCEKCGCARCGAVRFEKP